MKKLGKESTAAITARKLVSFLYLRPSDATSHYANVALAACLLSFALVATYSTGLIPKNKPAIHEGELDLSGVWKLSLHDDPNNSSLNLDERLWCPIGVPDPALYQGAAPSHCAGDRYPVEKMRSSTFWYRTTVNIPDSAYWKEPSLFLGAIKHKAWVYWDGELIQLSSLKLGPGITTVLLDQSQVRPGTHEIAIRVESLDTRYPGIFHAYPRKITLGDATNDISQYDRLIREKYIVPSISIFIQATGLVLTTLLIVLGRGSTQEFFWLAIYFFGSLFGNLSQLAPTELHQTFARLGIIITSLSILGYGLKFHSWNKNQILAIGRLTFAALLISVFAYLAVFFLGLELGRASSRLLLSISLFPFVFFLFGLASRHLSGELNNRLSTASDLFTIVILACLHATNVADEFFFSGIAISINFPAIKSALSIVLFVAMIRQFTEQERALAFFGRFIRPGLKSLLQERNSAKTFNDHKMFRPRKIAIMKVDIVGHTETTFQMPYGMKRLYQDTWFTLIDQVVSDRVFLDKNVGDGSIYCFSELHPDGPCNSALIAAKEIRDKAIASFDKLFNQRLNSLLSVTTELREPADNFFESYRLKSGVSFSEKRTGVRIALVYGFVDEGLWGLTSQSHYDVQGDLVSLAARIESKAECDEILMSSEFEFQLGKEGVNEKLLPRQIQLKGIGEVTVFSLTKQEVLSAEVA